MLDAVNVNVDVKKNESDDGGRVKKNAGPLTRYTGFFKNEPTQIDKKNKK